MFTGILFCVVGLIMLIFSRKWKSIIPLTIGVCLILLYSAGPLSPEHINERVAGIVYVEAENTKEIDVYPTDLPGENSLVEHIVRITDSSLIHQLCVDLNKAVSESDTYFKQNGDHCTIVFLNADGSRKSFHLKTSGGMAVLTPNSREEKGWHVPYGKIQVNKLFNSLRTAIPKPI